MTGAALDQETLRQLLLAEPPLLEDYSSLAEQLQPNGFDLSLQEVSRLTAPGYMGRDSDQRELSGTEVLVFDADGWLSLSPGPYLVTFNEIVNLPLDLMALGRPRSSLLRSGVSIHTAVWDAGYSGRSQAMLVVYHEGGYRIQQGARLMQLVFFRLEQSGGEGYQGRYQRENV